MFKDYYAILDISKSARLVEIKSAYRIQALKWHPDKNQETDTTEKMKDINEAKLILTDEEARIRYDKEHTLYKSFKQEKEKQNKTEESKCKHHASKKEKKSEKETYKKQNEKPKEEYSTYQFDDEILKKWMENARKQAIRNVHEMIKEFADSSVIGFGTFFSDGLKAILVAFIFIILLLIINFFKN